ncbi:MAG: hypothetical protein AAF721_10150 [Myxococcota bacterium]
MPRRCPSIVAAGLLACSAENPRFGTPGVATAGGAATGGLLGGSTGARASSSGTEEEGGGAGVGEGSDAAPADTAGEPLPPGEIIMGYFTPELRGDFPGALGAPNGSDIRLLTTSYCAEIDEIRKPVVCPSGRHVALLTVSDTDRLADLAEVHSLPADRRIVGSAGAQVAENFAALIEDGPDPDAIPFSSGLTWTGELGGNVENCDAWTFEGEAGAGVWNPLTPVAASWYESQASCMDEAQIACLCW